MRPLKDSTRRETIIVHELGPLFLFHVYIFAITWAQAKSCLSILLLFHVAIAFGCLASWLLCIYLVGSKDFIQHCNQIGLNYLEFSGHDGNFLREIVD
jgi:hypothetical protein